MNNKIVGQVLDMLNSAGKAIGSGAKYSFETMVKQEYINGLVWSITDAIGIVLSILSLIIIIKLYLKLYKKADEEKTRYGLPEWMIAVSMFSVILGVVALIISIILFAQIPENIMHMANPQYYAIKDIIHLIRK